MTRRTIGRGDVGAEATLLDHRHDHVLRQRGVVVGVGDGHEPRRVLRSACARAVPVLPITGAPW